MHSPELSLSLRPVFGVIIRHWSRHKAQDDRVRRTGEYSRDISDLNDIQKGIYSTVEPGVLKKSLRGCSLRVFLFSTE